MRVPQARANTAAAAAAASPEQESPPSAAAPLPPITNEAEDESGSREDDVTVSFACSELQEYVRRAHTAAQRDVRITDVILDADTELQEMLRVLLGGEYEPVSLVEVTDSAFARTATGAASSGAMDEALGELAAALRVALGAAGAMVPYGGTPDIDAAALEAALGDDLQLDDSTHEGALAKALYKIVSLRCHPDRNVDSTDALQARRRRLFVLANNAAHEQPSPNLLRLAAAAAAADLSASDLARLEGDGGSTAEAFSFVLEAVVVKEEAKQAAREASRAYKWRRLPPLVKMNAARMMAADVRAKRAEARAAEAAQSAEAEAAQSAEAEAAQSAEAEQDEERG